MVVRRLIWDKDAPARMMCGRSIVAAGHEHESAYSRGAVELVSGGLQELLLRRPVAM